MGLRGVGELVSDAIELLSLANNFLACAHEPHDQRHEQILGHASRLEMQRTVVARPIAPPDEPDSLVLCLGYGFGLVNFPSRSEWTVGHGGAVPGFGCHMRWSPNTGIGVLAVANLRYADLSEGCERILAAARAKVPARPLPLHPQVAARAGALLDLVREWDVAAAEQLFAFNFFIDYPREYVARRFSELRERYAAQLADARIIQQRGLSAKIAIGDCEIMTFTISSLEPNQIQELVPSPTKSS
jgi:CubicO group peptidase (beta-lactamase class C family)